MNISSAIFIFQISSQISKLMSAKVKSLNITDVKFEGKERWFLNYRGKFVGNSRSEFLCINKSVNKFGFFEWIEDTYKLCGLRV